jgi:superfamily II DNA or RNA helicase
VTAVVAGGPLIEVSAASGQQFVHRDDLALAPRDPLARIRAGEMGELERFGLFLRAFYLQHAYRYDPTAGLSNARIEPQLHQIYIAHRVIHRKLRPRMILADEVGLGKTIEAALIVKELTARQIVERVLILCPASLRFQWQQELQRKFNERFEIFDSDAVRHFGRDGANPWLKVNRVIASLPFGAGEKQAGPIVEAGWDLVIVDEAHHVRRRYQGPNKHTTTRAYALVDDLKETTSGLLFLTATPMQLHPFELFSLIELIEPGLYVNYDAYDARRKQLPALNRIMKVLQGWESQTPHRRDADLRAALALLPSDAPLKSLATSDLDDRLVRDGLQDQLVTFHPLAEVLVRNRKAEVGGFQRRIAVRQLVQLTDEETDLYHDITNYIRSGFGWARRTKNNAVGFLMVSYQKMLASSAQAIRVSFERRIEKLVLNAPGSATQEIELDDPEELSDAIQAVEGLPWDVAEIVILSSLVERLRHVTDSKADALINDVLPPLLEGDLSAKVVVFTQFRETQKHLESLLQHFDLPVALFHGSLRPEEKEEAIRRFRDEARILISTEAGGEGRNLQSAHILVNYDLPWNPMKVEQRIGRLDRIGQKRDVRILNLASAGTIEERVLDVLEHRIKLFEESVGSLDPILGEVEGSLRELLLTPDGDDEASLGRFEQDLERKVREAREKDRTLDDLILDRASLRRDLANEILGQAPLGTHTDLRATVADVLAHFGGDLQRHIEGGDDVALSMQLAGRLRTRQATIRGVFDPAEAREREELDFFAMGHPLIQSILALATEDPPLTAVYRSLSRGDAPRLDVYYELSSRGLRDSGKLIRHCIGPDLRVVSSSLASIPTFGDYVASHQSPEWLRAATEVSIIRFHAEVEEFRTDVRRRNDEMVLEEETRADRVAEYRRVRLLSRIADEETWIAQALLSRGDRDMRILPARQGKLSKTRSELAFLETEQQETLTRIRASEVDVIARVVAACFVVSE